MRVQPAFCLAQSTSSPSTTTTVSVSSTGDTSAVIFQLDGTLDGRAFQVLTTPSGGSSTGTPTSTPSPSQTGIPKKKPNHTRTGAIAGGVVGGFLLLLAVVAGSIAFFVRKKHSSRSTYATADGTLQSPSAEMTTSDPFLVAGEGKPPPPRRAGWSGLPELH